MMSIDEMLDAAIAFARMVLMTEKDNSLMPTFLIQEKHQTTFVGAPWSDENEKAMTISLMRRMLKDTGALSYSFISEAWVATEDPKHPIGLMPSEREDKREVVIMNAFDRKGGKVRIYEIVRGPDGAVTDLVLAAQPDNFAGRLHNLFCEEDRDSPSM